VTKTAKLLRLFRLAKLLRLARLRRIIKKYAEEFEGLMTAVKLIALLVCMLVLSHVLCCFWYGLGHLSDCGWVAHHYPCAAGTVVGCESGVLDLDFQVRCCSEQRISPGRVRHEVPIYTSTPSARRVCAQAIRFC
jgi:hypothetical protein